MRRSEINIGDYVTVFTIPRGDVVGQVVNITESPRFYNGYAVKIQLKFDKNLQTIKENIVTTTDLGNIEQVEKVLNEVKNKIDKLSNNLYFVQETITQHRKEVTQ